MSSPATPPDDVLEIRVLSGAQRDARCPVADGDSVGSDADCDVVIAEFPESAARLHCSEQGWQLIDEHGMASSPLTAFGLARMLGAVWITVAWQSSIWKVEAVDDDEAAQPVEAATAAAQQSGQATETRPEASPEARNTRRPAHALRLGLLSLALVALAALAWYAITDTESRPEPASAKTDKQLAYERVHQIITRSGLSDRVKVTMMANGSLQISGWLRDRSEQQRLAAALAAIKPRPAMNLTVHAEIPKALAGLLQQHDVVYQADYGTEGQLKLRGIARDAAQRVAVLDILHERLPGIRILGKDVLLADDVRASLQSQLGEAGLSGLTPAWHERTLRIDAGKLDKGESEKLALLVQQFNQGHFGVATISAEVAQGPMPFSVRSVVSGPAPFVILGDGSRLFEGGWHQQYRLSAIEEKRLIFDRPRTLIVPR